MARKPPPALLENDRFAEKHTVVSRSVILTVLCAIGLLHYLTPPTMMHWLYVLQRLYYVPVVLAALSWGWRGGLGIALAASLFFVIGTPSIWTVPPVQVLDQVLEVLVFLLVGLFTGILMDRQKRNANALRETTRQLNSVYRELQANFEGMKRAERLYALGQLSAGLAHEIRNPLASIEGAAVVVQRENQSEERRHEFLEIIQKECRRLNRLVSSFLDFAKPRQPHLTMVDLNVLLDSVIALAAHATHPGHVSLQKRVQPGLSTVECDAEQLKQVLLNLTMNAVQATPQGGTILLVAEEKETGLAIDVHDPGPGISSEDLDRIFDPFFTTKEAGTGLGLSVAHQIVTQHGGSLTVCRNSSDGATFRISLPVRQPHE